MKSRHFGRQTHQAPFARTSDAVRGVTRCFELASGSALFYQPVLVPTTKFGEETPGHPIEGAEEHPALAVPRFRHLNILPVRSRIDGRALGRSLYGSTRIRSGPPA
jgi:hypothetical protein